MTSTTTADAPLVTAQSVLDSIDFSERDDFNPAPQVPAGALRSLLSSLLAPLVLAVGATAAGVLSGTPALTLLGTIVTLGLVVAAGEKIVRVLDV